MRVPPLARFLALGGLLFAVDTLGAGSTPPAPDPITLSAATEQLLTDEVRDKLGRPPRKDEVAQARRTWEDTSLLVADARTLGLDQRDPIVRRRLAQKMRYLIADAAPPITPTDADLDAHLAEHPERFQVPTRVALMHRFFDRGARGAALDTSARTALQGLSEGQEAPGDPHAAGEDLALQTKQQLADTFGATFARAVVEAPLAQWSGPYASSRGLHLVHITERVPARAAKLSEMRHRIQADWRKTRRLSSTVSQLDALRRQHDLPPRGER